MELRHGTNPHQTASARPVTPGRWPMRVLNGQPSLINLLDALNGWQLVRQASSAVGKVAAASFKHVSPAGAAVADTVAEAYRLARDADRKSSYGDFVAVSHPVSVDLAELLASVVSDGIVAPGYEPGTVERLSRKKKGRYLVVEADPTFTPPAREEREVFGLRLVEDRDDVPLTPALLPPSGALPSQAVEDLLLGLAVLRFTQSNSVAYVRNGMTLGIGAGQQSRIDCTALAGAKVDTWWLRRHPDDLLDQVACVSDGAFPFRDNVDEAARHGVRYIAEPGGSIRSPEVEQACREHGITYVRTALRLFHH
ncbi:phosphoribosylaminoimidazolecarboxamide formyltransferase/IMP cyclohydrolase [Tenggerimyces flavus]|nr:phosphoribosylaminoimidazolecarboxamide formyltransferase/IMP cyclohydrolase [Tenggerimyces flavus]